MLLKEGMPILETAQEAGYFDQPHLSRSLKRLIGATPAEISRGAHQLSFLYKTRPVPSTYDAGGRSVHVHDSVEFSRNPG